jgi:hypothetical protein
MIFLYSLIVSSIALAQTNPPESIIEEITLDQVSSEHEIPTTYFSELYSVSKNDQGKVVAFSFSNNGVNKIIPKETVIGEGPEREFNFNMPERARQNIILMVTDVPSAKLSELMETYFMIFPRQVLPAIRTEESKIIVTLPNREEVIYNKDSKEIIGGAFKEGAPIDLGPDRFKRKFADITYTGNGLVLRVDRRGEDPRIGAQKTATAFYQNQKCKIPLNKLWEQDGEVNFLFPTDAAFFAFIKKTCGFEVKISSNPSL